MLHWISPVHAAAIPSLVSRRTRESGTVTSAIRSTWRSPSDTATILLIIGGDVIARALAQLAGPQLVPVAFSFGWVAYAFATLANISGDGRLLPPPDYDVKLFNPASGISRDNRSWVLGRLVRDMEGPLEPGIGISLSIHLVTSGGPPTFDFWYYLGFAVMLGQLGLATIPWILYGDWSILMLTASGIILCLLTGSLPQWKLEKFQARLLSSRGKGKVVALTVGNGSRHVFVIVDPGRGMDLEDLASGQSPLLRQQPKRWISMRARTQIACGILAFLWMVFLITWTSVDTNPWFVVAIGGSGMLHNVLVAGVKRKPSASGIHIKLVDSISRTKTMHGLMDAEMDYPGLGEVLLDEFFPTAHLRENEELWWKGDRAPYDSARPQASLVKRSNTADAEQARQEYAIIVKRKPNEVPSQPAVISPSSSPPLANTSFH
ncbi:hypothetical protein MSAN_00742600 [Mycena sanguinolenta]|uniref:Uncharacterized protein n=1 Tax=Mycena sanguinolenta TaxID=230812 RepID=A0A8H7DH01_9AGAR|nr:hypothetical protein MSAN_00742600 [Mycena sanguinolenta]